MMVEYLFSSPLGDIFLEPEDLSKPFLLAPEKPHPRLTLENYFDTIKACILMDRGKLLKKALKGLSHGDVNLEDVEQILIRSEKHGALYHIASVEAFSAEKRVKLTVTTAVSGKGIECIVREHDILDGLNRNLKFSFLPEIYGIRNMTCDTVEGRSEEMVMLAAQWFEDYHEWHSAIDPLDGRQKIEIWDLIRGHRYASAMEAFQIFEECAKILVLYYDGRDFNQIGAWHHAAGDFIVNFQPDGKLNVRLTTVRKYAPLPLIKGASPVISMTYFFLDTTVKMRLDRLGGVGEWVWADDFTVSAAVKGFLEGLRARESKGNGVAGARAEDVLSLLQSLDSSELHQLFEPLLAHYASQDSTCMDLIIARISDHIGVLRQTLQDFHWPGP